MGGSSIERNRREGTARAREVESPNKPRVAISDCLSGACVRYDGAHKRCDLVLREIGPYVEWERLCPEVGAGMTTPREPIELLVDRGTRWGVRVVEKETGNDWTCALVDWGERQIERLRAMSISGYIFKSRSPSCGVGSAPRRKPEADADAAQPGDGLFAAMLRDAFPALPVAQESQLSTRADCRGFLDEIRRFAGLR